MKSWSAVDPLKLGIDSMRETPLDDNIAHHLTSDNSSLFHIVAYPTMATKGIKGAVTTASKATIAGVRMPEFPSLRRELY